MMADFWALNGLFVPQMKAVMKECVMERERDREGERDTSLIYSSC